MLKTIIFTGLVISYLVFTFWILRRIIKTKYLNRLQKIFNILMTLIIPFIWGLLINEIIKPSDLSVKTRHNRSKRKANFTDNWENLTGFGG